MYALKVAAAVFVFAVVGTVIGIGFSSLLIYALQETIPP